MTSSDSDPAAVGQPEASALETVRVRPSPVFHLLLLIPFGGASVLLLVFGRTTPLNVGLVIAGVLATIVLLYLSVRSGVAASRQGLTVRDLWRSTDVKWEHITEFVEEKSFGLVALKTDGSILKAVPYSVFRGPKEIDSLALRFNNFRRQVLRADG